VADAGTSLHDGDQIKTTSPTNSIARGPLMALNSRMVDPQPLPSIVFSIILLVLGWVSFSKLA